MEGVEVGGTLSEVSHVHISIAPPLSADTTTNPYALTARARSRMVLASNTAELGTYSHFFIGPSYTLQEWQAEDSKKIRGALTAAIEFFAADIIAKCCTRSACGSVPHVTGHGQASVVQIHSR